MSDVLILMLVLGNMHLTWRGGATFFLLFLKKKILSASWMVSDMGRKNILKALYAWKKLMSPQLVAKKYFRCASKWKQFISTPKKAIAPLKLNGWSISNKLHILSILVVITLVW